MAYKSLTDALSEIKERIMSNDGPIDPNNPLPPPAPPPPPPPVPPKPDQPEV